MAEFRVHSSKFAEMGLERIQPLAATDWDSAIGEFVRFALTSVHRNATLTFGLQTRTQFPVFVNGEIFIIRLIRD